MKKVKIKSTEFDFRTIKSYKDAAKQEKVHPVNSLPDVKGVPRKLKKYIIAAYKLAIIASAIRNGSKLDWTDSNQIKYEPYHCIKADKKKPSGFGFSGSHYDLWNALTGVGSRLCFETSEKAIYFAENFHDLWIDFKIEI